ncbi:signal transduction histidine kinase [Herbihabitans rhizosphaerae]|uniref:histidine kinase n=1 Tax=Herbihabitans rhizosphaerae TaxID=1872711 RepID=A0A4Q7L2F8_9PSEU|nr:sensor histidine kinase [Herbihabitans rhizosphaerae]RZS43397.1 signal transduction histidine kinase [Herbihabitans rhizosphaerae]
MTTISRRPYGDVALVALLIIAASGPAVLNSNLSATDNLSWRSAVPLAVAGALALVWRRSHPRAVVVFTAACACTAGALGYLITPLLIAPLMVALYELAVRIPGRTTYWFGFVVTVATVVTALTGDAGGYPWFLTVLNPILFLLLPVLLALATRLRAENAERNREEETRHRVAEERVRIARELHDVVAHHLALANAQAGTAAYLARTRPEQVQPILTELTGTTSAALRELKATVGLLRQPDDPGSPLEPMPGLDRLPDLTAGFAAAGLDVEITVEGERRPLSSGVDLTAYRIVQEALTNVTKHADTCTARVLLHYDHDRLTITVTNDGAPTNSRGGKGFGLIGMRERAHSAGGSFHAGARPSGGFTVTTELPAKVDS